MDEALRAAAFAAMTNAYAPYSEFRVGAAVLAANGAIFAGCNVENASYGGGICAERGAVMAAVAAGARDFRRVLVATEASEPTPPCGACRQVMIEFGRPQVASTCAAGTTRRWAANELLPGAFALEPPNR